MHVFFVHGFFAKDGNLPIHYAARHNNGEAVEALIKAGANPNQKNKDGEVCENSHLFFVLSHPFDALAPDRDCCDPQRVQRCSSAGGERHNKKQVSKFKYFLLQLNGADPFAQDKSGAAAADIFFSKKEKLGGGGSVLVADGAEVC